MICRYCGKEIRDDSGFCIECGHIIEGSKKKKCMGKKRDRSFPQQVLRTGSGQKHSDSGWVKKLLVIEVVAVILGFFLIAGALEGPGSYNRKLNTVTLDFKNLFSVRNKRGFVQQFPRTVQGSSFEETIILFAKQRVESLEKVSQIGLDEYEITMDLPAGPCTGKYIIIHNNNDITVDVKADFSFYDTQGRLSDGTTFDEYGIAAHGIGIVLGQTDGQEISHIDRKISVSPSNFIPVSDCVSYTVKDQGEEGIRVTVKNHSSIDIEDFRIRVLWFQDSQLETVAYRWLELEDHTFYAGDKQSLDFNRKWGNEKYMIILQGKAHRLN